MPYPNEIAMSPEDRDEQDRRRWEHYDRMTWGDPDAFDKHRDDELTKQHEEVGYMIDKKEAAARLDEFVAKRGDNINPEEFRAFISRKGLCQYLGISQTTLTRYLVAKSAPKPTKIPRFRGDVFDVSDVEAWIKEHTYPKDSNG